jgi:hypothetical protein
MQVCTLIRGKRGLLVFMMNSELTQFCSCFKKYIIPTVAHIGNSEYVDFCSVQKCRSHEVLTCSLHEVCEMNVQW